MGALSVRFSTLICSVMAVSVLTGQTNGQETSTAQPNCRVDMASIHEEEFAEHLITRDNNLVRYDITVIDHAVNPLKRDSAWSYKSSIWFRASSWRNRRILKTAFSFRGMPPMAILSYIYSPATMLLRDSPVGCMANMTEEEKVAVVRDLLLGDLRNGSEAADDGQPDDDDEVSTCHQAIERTDAGYAQFIIECCHRDEDGEVVCSAEVAERWLRLLDLLLITVRVVAFLIGPLFVPECLYRVTQLTSKYVVKLDQPLRWRVAIADRAAATPGTVIHARRVLDLRRRRGGWASCRRAATSLARNVAIPVTIRQYDIDVGTWRLLSEAVVPVTLFKYIAESVFFCRLRRGTAIRAFCQLDAIAASPAFGVRARRWKDVCNVVGRCLFVLLLPAPFYLRLLMYYRYEYPELRARSEAAENLHLSLLPNYRLMHYCLPSFVLVSVAYVVYIVGALRLASINASGAQSRFQRPISESFAALKQLNITQDIDTMVGMFVWPLKRFGTARGLIVGLVYWPVVMPVYACCGLLYSTPLIFLSVDFVMRVTRSDGCDDDDVDGAAAAGHSRCHTFTVVVSIILLLCAAMLLFCEVVGFFVEVMCLVVMGMVMDALKYISVVCLLYIYSIDCYGAVSDDYIRLNHSLHRELRDRIGSELDAFVSLPPYLRQHRAFKATEADEQAAPPHEKPDAMVERYEREYWFVNDLVLFVDSHDRPRIPRRLFDDVCSIDLPASPGPPGRALVVATCRFGKIVVFLTFVFSIVFAFGDSYRVSSVKQLLATLAGGFLPIVFRKVLLMYVSKETPMTVSFRCRIEEVIRNFRQSWPMNDLQFEVDTDALRSQNAHGDSQCMPRGKLNVTKVDLLIIPPSDTTLQYGLQKV